MNDGAARFDRQIRLPEVGEAGQARIASLRAIVRGREGALVEALFLHRAGVRAVEMAPGEAAEPFDHAGWFRTEAAREVGAGAWRSLRKIRGALGGGPR